METIPTIFLEIGRDGIVVSFSEDRLGICGRGGNGTQDV